MERDGEREMQTMHRKSLFHLTTLPGRGGAPSLLLPERKDAERKDNDRKDTDREMLRAL